MFLISKILYISYNSLISITNHMGVEPLTKPKLLIVFFGESKLLIVNYDIN